MSTRCIFPALICLPALAQEFRGTILGRVVDPSGAPVAGARVEALNVETQAVARTVTNEPGNYQIPFLLPAVYTLRVEQAGFKKIERSGVRVSTNEQVRLDFTLELGSASESITVSAEAPVLNTANADLGQVIDNSYFRINLFGRNAITYALLAPGVTGSGGTYTSNAQMNFSIAGGGSTRGNNEVLIDGIPNVVAGGNLAFVPSMESVEEVRVQTTMFDATYGHSNGGALIITSRGGTNSLHGAVYYYKNIGAWTTNSWNNNRLGLAKPPIDYHQWGYTVSGPVLLPKVYNGRNRTFFTTSLERDNNPRELTRQSRVPSVAERQGDFSSVRNRLGGVLTIFDPDSTIRMGNTVTRTPFAGNRIPAARLSPVGAAVAGKFPAPTIAGAPNQIGAYNWAASGVYTVAQRQVAGRIDHILSDRQRLFGRLGYLTRNQVSDVLFPGVIATADAGSTDLGVLLRRFTNFGFDDTITFSPTFVGSFRLGLARRATNSDNGAYLFDPAELRLPEAIIRNQFYKGWPSFNLGEGFATIGSSASTGGATLYSFLATLTKLAGKHSIKTGVDYRLSRVNNISPGNSAFGDFSFNSLYTQSDPFNARSADTSGSSLASLLLGAPNSGSFGYATPTSLQSHYFAWFVQDDWKVHRRLTINLGLRHEFESAYTERYNRISYGFDENATLPIRIPDLPLRGGVLFAGEGGNPRSGGRLDRNNLGPRAGLAFSITPKTILRAGYGIFYAVQLNNNGFAGEIGVFNAVTPLVGTTDNGATIANTIANPFPAGLRSPQGSSAGLLAQAGDALSFFDQKRVSPYNQQWQFSLQREVPGRIVLEAAYMGMHSLKQLENFNLNEKPDRFLALGAAENTRVPNPFFGLLPVTSVLGASNTITQNRLWGRFPQYTNLNDQGTNTGRGLYHSLQIKADKRLSRGLSFLWAYTYSRLMDNNTTSVTNPRFYRAVSPLDQKHYSRFSLTYQLPFRFAGSPARRLLEGALGGWNLSSTVTLATGAPLSVSHAFGRPLRIRNPRIEGGVGSRLGDRRDGGRVVNPYFDTGAFAPLANQYTITPEPPTLDELRAPPTKGLDLGLLKTLRIGESRRRVELLLRATGVTNSPNFNAPDTNLSNAATFGVITGAGGNRSMQGGVRFAF